MARKPQEVMGGSLSASWSDNTTICYGWDRGEVAGGGFFGAQGGREGGGSGGARGEREGGGTRHGADGAPCGPEPLGLEAGTEHGWARTAAGWRQRLPELRAPPVGGQLPRVSRRTPISRRTPMRQRHPPKRTKEDG